MHKIRIGIDGRALSNINRLRGIGKYTSRIIGNLVEIGSDYEFVVFGYGKRPGPGMLPEGAAGNIEWIEIPQTRRVPLVSIISDHLLFAGAVNSSGVSLFHGLDHNMTPFLKCSSIITVHDLILLILKGPYLGPTSWLWMRSHQLAARRASALITVSESTKNDVMRLWKIPEDRIRTVYEGVDGQYSPDAGVGDRSFVVNKYGIDKPYFLYIGGFDPRKNIGNMLTGFKRFMISSGPTHKLLLCGDAKGFEEYLNDEIEQLGLKDNVAVAGFIPDEDLPAIYRNATALVFVSIYEGFGLPLLESMACGTPIITAANSSIPEIAGKSAFYVDPLEPEEIAGAMSALAGDETLRENLRTAGIARSRNFTWAGTAVEILDLYSRILGGVV
ncbi:MAG: glycosyltransferase family 4 protein [Actinobacteria bacterium]|nr:glycosyltransferase family 4 protein [Actinomycetota bacterium]